MSKSRQFLQAHPVAIGIVRSRIKNLNKLNFTRMKKLLKYFLFVFTLLHNLSGIAQLAARTSSIKQVARDSHSTARTIQELKIGDVVPDFEFEVTNASFNRSKLSNLKHTLLILDFWATWCSSCIVRFPKLDSLQRKFANDVKFFLVNSSRTGDTDESVGNTLTKLKQKYPEFQIPSIIKDTVLDKMFPHTLIPHYIWINSDFKVVAITSSSEITEENINRVLNGQPFKYKVKKDIDLDRPLYLNADFGYSNVEQYSILLKGEQIGLPTGCRFRRRDDVVNGFCITNTPLLEIYKTAISKINSTLTAVDKRIILEVVDSSQLIYDPGRHNKDEWDRENLYSFDMIVPLEMSKNLFGLMFQSLNQFSKYLVSIEKRKVSCFALVPRHFPVKNSSNKEDDPNSRTNIKLMSFSNSNKFVNWLNNTSLTKSIVVNKIPASKDFKLELPSSITESSFLTLKLELNSSGYDLVEMRANIDMIVIREKGF